MEPGGPGGTGAVLDDLADAGESDAGARKLARRMKPLDRPENHGCLDGSNPAS
jgi:hypothetical protein